MKKRAQKRTGRNKINFPLIALFAGILLFFVNYIYYDYVYPNLRNEGYFILLLLGGGLSYIGLFLTFKKPYTLCIKYIKDSKKFIYFAVGFFIFSAFLGFLFYEQLGFLETLLKAIVEKTKDLNVFETIDFIFFNNLAVSFFGIFLGIFIGIVPFLYILSNGVVLGYVFHLVADESSIWEFWRILPHGIFELPAIFISLALGLKLGAAFFSGNIKKELKLRLHNSLLVFLFVIAPLLIIAAIIEGALVVLFK